MQGDRQEKTYLPIQARRASECVHFVMRQMHALAGEF